MRPALRVLASSQLLGVLTLGFMFVPIPPSTLVSQLISPSTPWAIAVFLSALGALALPRPSGRPWVLISLLGVLLAFASLTLKVGIGVTSELGFRSCYQIESPINPEGFRDGSCEATYDWFRPNSGSRFDANIAFGSLNNPDSSLDSLKTTNWNLSAINHLIYNYYDWDPRLPLRERLPLTVYWAGQTPNTDPLVVTYLGEGVIRSGDQTIPFVPTYTTPNSVVVENRSDKEISIEYTWHPPDGSVNPPFAAISLTNTSGTSVGPLVPATSGALLLLTAGMIFGSLIAIWILAVRVLLTRDRGFIRGRRVTMTAWASMLLWAFSLLSLNKSVWGPALSSVLLLIMFLTVGIRYSRGTTRLIAFLSIGVTALVGVFGAGVPWRFIPVLRGGDDFLTYESFAREILITGSLRAGEDVFYFAPGVRYSLFGLHALFGDGNSWIWVISIVLLLVSAWLVINRLVVSSLATLDAFRPGKDPWIVLGGALGVFGLGLLIGSDVVWRSGIVLLSEFPTWPALMIALVLSLSSKGRIAILLSVGLLLGFALAHRSNQAIGIGAIAVTAIVFAWKANGVRRTTACKTGALAAVFLPLAAVAGLIPLHNWIYGRRLVFTHDPQVVSLTTVVEPSELLRGSEAWLAAWQQTQGLLILPSSDFPIPYDASLAFGEYASTFSPTGWAARLLQVAVVVSVVLCVLRLPGTRWRDLWLLVVPVGFFLPHIFLNLSTYYPRHTIAGYLTLAIVLIAISTRSLMRGGSPAKPIRDREPAPAVNHASR